MINSPLLFTFNDQRSTNKDIAKWPGVSRTGIGYYITRKFLRASRKLTKFKEIDYNPSVARPKTSELNSMFTFRPRYSPIGFLAMSVLKLKYLTLRVSL